MLSILYLVLNINYSKKSFLSSSLGQFFLTLGENNFRKKIPFPSQHLKINPAGLTLKFEDCIHGTRPSIKAPRSSQSTELSGWLRNSMISCPTDNFFLVSVVVRWTAKSSMMIGQFFSILFFLYISCFDRRHTCFLLVALLASTQFSWFLFTFLFFLRFVKKHTVHYFFFLIRITFVNTFFIPHLWIL